uniref:Uncharacterized protein n=1 Tax=Leishmania guyanensis TaxID=5670 RepID=A0A1E1IWB3_LEIGU|nr:hypothetical protein, conserved [Leishmania guyanensis]
MPSIQVAGRHGSYATQFWKPAAWTATTLRFHDRAGMRAAYSRKAIDRRLVLPLDSHNWIRALEVLNAGYARLGRTPEHFQRVLRDMVEHHSSYAECVTRSASAFAPPSLTESPRSLRGAGAGVFDCDSRRLSCSSTEMLVGSEEAPDILPAVDALRDRAYAGEIPSNRSLWVTLVWSYCALDQPSGALDTFHLATRRFRFSSATMQHMATLLLPVLCRHAQLEEAINLYETYLKVNDAKEDLDDSSASSHHRSRLEDADARRWLAEAAAQRGDLKRAQSFAGGARRSPGGVTAADDEPRATANNLSPRPTIDSLFHDTPRLKKLAKLGCGPHLSATSEDSGRTRGPEAAPRSSAAPSSLPVLQTLSCKAVRQLFRSLCRGSSETHSDARLCAALCCWSHLYGPALSAAADLDGDAMSGHCDGTHNCCTSPPPLEDVHELLNLFASHQRWKDVLSIFCRLFLSRPATVYLSSTLTDLQSLSASMGGREGALTVFEAGEAPIAAPALRLDAITLNLLFSSLPAAAAPLLVRAKKLLPTSPRTATKGHDLPQLQHQPRTVGEAYELQLSASAVPVTVVRLLDDLLLLRDDMILTDLVMAAIGPALLQVGQIDRVFDLLARTPMMVSASQRKAPAYVSTEHQALKAELVALGYATFALCPSSARRHEMVRQLPHLFPPEVVRRFASGGEGDMSSSYAILEDGAVLENHSRVVRRSATTAAALKLDHSLPPHYSANDQCCCSGVDSSQSSSRANITNTAALSLLDLKSHAATPASAGSGGQLNTSTRPGRRSSAATLTSLADDAMRRDYVRLQERRFNAFTGSHADAERDPRPIPKGLHDHASGWDFFGRGGEMVFANHNRTSHPFTMRPKVMRDLRNPYRGWNPRRNSSLAHKENVVKWNGKSAV